MADRDPGSLARGYYEAIDAGDYERLAGLLDPDFRQVRGDRTIEGRDAFVRFMREERPMTDTTHEVDAMYRREGGGGGTEGDGGTGGDVAIRGRLLRADGSVWFGFVDVFRVTDGRLARLTTYSNGRISSPRRPRRSRGIGGRPGPTRPRNGPPLRRLRPVAHPGVVVGDVV